MDRPLLPLKVSHNKPMKLVLGIALFASLTFAADRKLGQPLTAKESLTVAAVFAEPAPLIGKTVQVKGTVAEVCTMMGCWMNLADDQGHSLHIKVDEGVIVFPKDSVGKTAIAEGKLEKHDLTRDQVIAAAKEEAADTGRKFDPSTVKSGKTVYELAGLGAVILNP
jgi:hypothetical protein